MVPHLMESEWWETAKTRPDELIKRWTMLNLRDEGRGDVFSGAVLNQGEGNEPIIMRKMRYEIEMIGFLAGISGLNGIFLNFNPPPAPGLSRQEWRRGERFRDFTNFTYWRLLEDCPCGIGEILKTAEI